MRSHQAGQALGAAGRRRRKTRSLSARFFSQMVLDGGDRQLGLGGKEVVEASLLDAGALRKMCFDADRAVSCSPRSRPTPAAAARSFASLSRPWNGISSLTDRSTVKVQTYLPLMSHVLRLRGPHPVGQARVEEVAVWRWPRPG